MDGFVSQSLSGWGRYPVEVCQVSRPATRAALRSVVISSATRDLIPRGLGRSYGDSALNLGSGVILQTPFNRFLDFDDQTGVLSCEAGVSFAEIIDHFLPRGWFLPTTPGTKFVTVGGAIAADVHGKNHHRDGSFGNFVLDLQLLLASGEVLRCSPTEQAEVFWATVGGMGLTGIILEARLKLQPVETAFCQVAYRRTRNLDETLTCFAEADQNARYSVAWIDCLASGRSLGRSVVMQGNNARPSDLPRALQQDPLRLPIKGTKSVPCNAPPWILNSWSVRAFNAIYYRSHGNDQRCVDFNSFFYPLDSLLHWNRIYGRRGFVQYQALFPPESSAAGLVELLERIAVSRSSSFLAVLKSSGAASPGVLSYLHPGHTLALDIPNTGESLRLLASDLDRIVLRYGGRLYLAKDTLASAEAIAEMYPRLREFRRIKARLDPLNRFCSSQSKRLRIVEGSR